ncbi:hypothetical protein [Luteolibacter luteus]|uniref:DUF892 family protein n=1 Tax=Luteolibacter luteus TaxID=2728835 RepID=A0A858RMQ1_9BACT|nr:hypothetical protein [Luteolibacter luteus]QJE97764.1 hypothetical protein HHL09_18920 [Luteolibacter luteus]
MENAFEHYLNDHLAGATGAILLIGDLAKRQEDDTERLFFQNLQEEVSGDRDLLTALIRRAGMEEKIIAKVTGDVGARAGKLKLMWDGLEPGKLGYFEALEILALGIQGKRLLWTVLGEVASLYPEWTGVDFEALAKSAKRQRDEVEQRRLNSGRATLPSPERLPVGS